MLKEDVKPEEIQIYELYLQRIMKEYDLIWTRFKIYFGFNSGVLVIIGFLIKPYLSALQTIPKELLYFIILLSVFGFLFSIAWFLVNRDGHKWQILMNEVIEKVENSLFEETSCALYKRINSNYSNQKSKIDIIDINLHIVRIFSSIWLLLIVFSINALK